MRLRPWGRCLRCRAVSYTVDYGHVCYRCLNACMFLGPCADTSFNIAPTETVRGFSRTRARAAHKAHKTASRSLTLLPLLSSSLPLFLTPTLSLSHTHTYTLTQYTQTQSGGGQELRTAKKAVQEAAPGAVVEDECLDVCGGAINVTIFKLEGGKPVEVCKVVARVCAVKASWIT